MALALAALFATLLESPALVSSASLVLGTFACALVFGLPGATVGLAVDRLRLRRRWLGVVLLAAGVALALIAPRVYVRLYLAAHLAASCLAVSLLALGFAILQPPPRAAKRRLVAPLAALVLWLAAFGISLPAIVGNPALRFRALEKTAILGQGLLVLHQAYGVLSPAQGPGAPALPPLVAVTHPTATHPRANVLWITVDALRADSVPPGGAIAALAARGVSFTRAWSPSCWTVHAMAATMTSRLPSQLRFTPVSIDPSLKMTPHAPTEDLVTNPLHFKKTTPVPYDDRTPTLAGILRAAGYQTATFVAYVFYRAEGGLTREFETVDDAVYREHNRDLAGVTSPPLTDAALAFLDHRDAARPFFLWLHYLDPHHPYVDHDGGGGDDRSRYGSETRFTDRELGRLLDGLAARGLADSTIVIVHADHGEEFGDHGGQFHATTLYEEILHVPLIVAAPRVAARTVDALVSLDDLVPTVVDLVGAATPAAFLGRSLAPALTGGAPPAGPRFAECTRFGRDKRAVLDWPWKLIVDLTVGTFELYDLQADPREQHNVVATQRAIVTRLSALLGAAP